ncbi:MAG: hypothetical protein RLZZ618_3575 [Pseudomonadota bacterium]
MKVAWTIRLSAHADQDYRDIVRWTQTQFGTQQARLYASTLSSALRELKTGPLPIGAKPREDIGPGLCTLHVARKGHKGRHFIVFRIASAPQTIDVLRLLHDSMDLPRHGPDIDGAS